MLHYETYSAYVFMDALHPYVHNKSHRRTRFVVCGHQHQILHTPLYMDRVVISGLIDDDDDSF